ncbi:MAG: conserved repeat domain protein [Thermoleophilia bacterium]|nr:conserved repeat domain protein [Thermoleophilia bacterium]
MIRVKNTGNYPLTNVTLDDLNCSATTPLLTLAPGAEYDFTCSKTTSGAGTTWNNEAQATGTSVFNLPVTSAKDDVTARVVTTGLTLTKRQATTGGAFADATHGEITVRSGDTIHYVIRVKNTGNYPLTNVTLDDPNCTTTTPIATLGAGAEFDFTCSKSTSGTGTTQDNDAQATGTDVLDKPVTSPKDVVTARVVTTGLTLDKRQALVAGTFAAATNAELTVRSGDTVHYVIRVTNTGNYALTNVTLTDPNCTTTTPLASLAAGAQFDFTCSKTTSGAGTTWRNEAQATGTDVLDKPVASLKDDVTARVVTTGLTLEKRQSATAGTFEQASDALLTVRSGDTIHYVIRVKNTGNYALTNVTLTDPNCSTTTPLTTLAAGAEHDFTCSKTTSGAGTTWNNEAQATGTDVLDKPVTSPKDDVTARVVTTGLTLAKRQATSAGSFADATHGQITVRSGDTIHYVIRVKNTGNYAVTHVTLTDPNCSTTTPLASLDAGAEYDFTCSKTTSGTGTTQKNEAQATGTDVLDKPVTSPKDDVTARVVTTGLTLDKRQSTNAAATFATSTDDELTVRTGTKLWYVIRVTNTGNHELTNVTLDDANCSTTTPLATLAAGAAHDFTCSKTTSGTDTAWTNEAQATGTDVLDKPVTSPKDHVSARTLTTGLTLDKRQSTNAAATYATASDADLTVRTNTTIYYVIRVKNTGNYELSNVTLTDANCTSTAVLATLAPNAEHDFTCSQATTGTATSHDNTAQATGTDLLGAPVTSLPDTVYAKTLTTGLALDKRQSTDAAATFDDSTDAQLTVPMGTTLYYVIRVKNKGNYALTNVTLTDANCTTTTAVPTLAPNDTFDFRCSQATTGTALTHDNFAVASGTDLLGGTVTSPQDSVSARTLTTGLELDKRQAKVAGAFADATDAEITVRSGDTIHYVIRVTNSGNYALTNVTLTDPNCSATTPIPTLGAGLSADFTCSRATSGAGTTQKNEAQATGTDLLDKPVTSPKDDVTARVVTTGLTLDKRQATSAGTFAAATDAQITVRSGDTIHYVIRAKNTGNYELTNVTLTDPNCSATTPLGTLAAGASYDFTCSKTTSGAGTTQKNEAQATGTDVLDAPVTSLKDDVTARVVTTGLELDKRQSITAPANFAAATHGEITVRSGDTIHYVIRVKNTGNYPLTDVTLDDPNCSATTPIGTLGAGAVAYFECASVTSGANATFTNTAQATGTDVLLKPVTSPEDAVTARVLTVGLELDKRQATSVPADFTAATDNDVTVRSGDSMYYVIQVKNTGNYALTNVTLDDPKCAGAAVIATLAAGATDYFTCSATTSGIDTTYVNTAKASGTDVLLGAVTSNTDKVTARVVTTGLTLDKRQAKSAGTFADATDAEITVRSGDTIHYVIRVKNTGNYPLTNVTLDDPNCTATTAVLTLAANAEHDYTCSKTTSGTDTTQKNEAQATGTDVLDKPVTSLKDDVTARVVTTGLTLDKRQAKSAGTFADATDAEITVRSGDTIHYVIRVKNTGNYALANVTLTDPNCTATTPVLTLATGAEHDFSCSKSTTGAAKTWNNEAQATGTDVLGQPVTSPKDDVTARVLTTGLTLDKRQAKIAGTFADATDAQITVRSGATLHYVIRVKNTGNYELTNVTLDDPACSATTAIATLAPDAEHDFTCSATTSGAATEYENVATASGTDVLTGTVTSNTDKVVARTLTTGLELDKRQDLAAATTWADATDANITAHAGDTIHYDIRVKNTGNYDVTNVTLDDTLCSNASPASVATLAPGATTLFTCDHTTDSTSNAATYTNTATAHAVDLLGAAVDSNPDSVVADLKRLELSLAKLQSTDAAGAFATTSLDVYAGATIHYQLVATNLGNVDTTVTPTDAGCTNLDATPVVIAPGKTATFTCRYATTDADAPLPSATTGMKSNQGSVSGTDAFRGSTGPVASNVVTANVHRLKLTTLKEQSKTAVGGFTTGSITVYAGETIYYRVTVTNDGNTPTTVTPHDAGCDKLAPTATLLAPGASTNYTCEHAATVADARSATGTYTNTANATGAHVNGGTTTSNDSAVTARVLVTVISMSKTVFDVETGTWTSSNRAHVGDTIRYTITVANTGNNTLAFELVDAKCTLGPKPTESIKAAATASYTCEHMVLATDGDTYVNTATIDGTDEGGRRVTDQASATTTILKPDFTLTKQVRVAGSGAAFAWTTSAHVGATLEYEIVVTNVGNTPLTFDLTDPACGALASTAPAGHDGVDDVIAPAASVRYSCTHVIGPLDPNPYVNVVRAVGTDGLGLGQAKDAHADATIVVPGLTVDKQVRNATANRPFTDSDRAVVGNRLEFRHTVSSTGNTPLTVNVKDDRCEGLAGPAGFDGVNDVLAPGQTVEYTCFHVLTATDPNPFVNVVTVTGTDPLGGPVTATDRASVTVDAVPVAAGGPAPVVGSSRLTPPSGCQRGAFRVLVTGSNIRLVQFLVDGRVRATVRRATSGNRWIGRLTTSGLRGGTTHRLAVRVTYTSATGQRAVVRSARFGVCRPVAVMPAFTG